MKRTGWERRLKKEKGPKLTLETETAAPDCKPLSLPATKCKPLTSVVFLR